MPFTGHAEHAIDAKLRLSLPKRHRAQWDPQEHGEAWYCIPWPTGVLRLYPSKTFQRLAEQSADSLTPSADQAELETTLYGLAEMLTVDAQGRIMLPKEHLEMTGLGRSVVVVGVRNRLEIHDLDAWRAERQRRFAELPNLVHKVERS
ncbi:MAG: transcriptional regulator MraZ [Phycisphaerales bacterium]|nr:MAG: transcriptional regulator MraZ [Phycisphaerales bacterium]